MKLTEKIAYMRGLFEGMQLDPNTKEGKAITYMAEVLSEAGEHIDKLESRVDELEELCDLLDEDLNAVEEDLYEDDDDEEDDEDSDDDDWDDYDWDEDDDEDYSIGKVLPAEEPRFDRGNEDGFDDFQYVVTCPSCKQDVSLTEYDLEEGSMDCPHCGELLEFDYDDIETDTSDDSDSDDGENGENGE